MERLTYDFALGGNHCWQVKGADNLECREVCERQGDAGCKTCPIAKAFDRLAAYEDTGLEPCDYSAIGHALEKADRAQSDLTEMIRLVGGIGLDRLRELAQADREGRCVVLDDLTVADLQQMLTVLDSTHYGDGAETYTTGYRNGHRNGRIEILRHVLGIYEGTRADAEAALRREQEAET